MPPPFLPSSLLSPFLLFHERYRLQNVASRMSYIFDKLKALERTIILFDEIEEFCLDRENPNLGMESRMLTTAMLTQLNDLRRQQACIFIVATNRLRSFDAGEEVTLMT